MDKVMTRAVAIAAFMVFVGTIPAFAIPVSAPFGSDTFPRAIHFTSTAKPADCSNGAIQNLYRGNDSSRDSGVIMRPVGDGSYVCTAAVYPGGQYSYYFSFRNRTFEADTYTSWLVTAPNAERDQDVNRARTITIPSAATHGYIVYNAYGDQSVLGFQGPDTSVTNTTNGYLTMIGGTGDTPGLARLYTEGGDTKFANMSGSNAYGFDAVQTGDSEITMSWSFGIGGSEAYVPSVHGANTHIGVQRIGGSPQYGFRIWRADSPASGVSGAVFIDRTAAITGSDTNWADNDNNPFNGVTCVDTSIRTESATHYLYLVTWYNAYQYYQNDTTRQNFSGGYDTVTRSNPIRVFFIVEHFEDSVVFPDGTTHGKVYLTPVIDGVRRPDLRTPAEAVKVTRNTVTG